MKNNKDNSELYNGTVLQSNDPRRYCIDWIDKDGVKILDVGCACGDFCLALKQEKNVRNYGMEYNPKSIEIAEQTKVFEKLFQVDLNNFDPLAFESLGKSFDYIVFGDVLEHILKPQEVLNKFKFFLKQDGFFLISFPNIAHACIKSNILLNNFDYTDAGLLDKTHINFFTYKRISKFLSDINVEIVNYKYTISPKCGDQKFNPYPFLPDKITSFILSDPHSFVYQYVVKCKVSKEQSETIQTNNLKILESQTRMPLEYKRRKNARMKKFIKLLKPLIKKFYS